MHYVALATDFDGTLARDGRVPEATLAAMERLRLAGRKLILVTGRELDDLQRVFPELDRFDRLVLENGGLLYRPDTRETVELGPPPPPAFVERLRERGVPRISVGRVVVATWRPHEDTVLEAIRDMGLEHHIIFNKDAVMVLPSGINKAVGLERALSDLGLAPHNVVGVGDAENDHAFLMRCGCSVAVANALDSLKEEVDLVTGAARGEGVLELVERMLDDDLASLDPALRRHRVLLGERLDREGREPVYLPPLRHDVLITGTSGGGKTNMTTAVIEGLLDLGHQVCVLDPEGDYEQMPGLLRLGDATRPPSLPEAMTALEDPGRSVALDLLGIPAADRPAFLAGLLAEFHGLRSRTGRPHWLVVDEAHHMLPCEGGPAADALGGDVKGLFMITVEPEHLARRALSVADRVIAVGREPGRTLRRYAELVGVSAPDIGEVELGKHEALLWDPRGGGTPVHFRAKEPRADHKRHLRKYAEGSLAPEKSFYFRGPEGRLNLRAQNLTLFVQLSEGVDDETWLHHLRRGDYSRWFADSIGDEELAAEAGEAENAGGSAEDSRRRVLDAVNRRYTAPP
jgi:hypothetical protein